MLLLIKMYLIIFIAFYIGKRGKINDYWKRILIKNLSYMKALQNQAALDFKKEYVVSQWPACIQDSLRLCL